MILKLSLAKVHKFFKKNQTSGGKVYTFDDVEGCDEAKEELKQVVEFLKNPLKFTKLGAKMPKGVLLVGPPGTGKTLLAKAVAGEAEVPFIYASGSEFDEMFVGIGSMRIRQMFQSAKEQAPAIIFIDEIDAVGSKRNARDPQHSRMSLNQLLIELDGFSESTGVVVIAATNFPETLDKALLRPGRFDKHVHVPLPDVTGRRKILNLFTRDIKLAKDVDLALVSRATPGFSGADLNKLINQAKIMASLENSPSLQMSHLERSRDEMLMGAERKSFLMSLEDRKLTAYHEGGHALVALYSENATPLHKATIIPRGSALGLVSQVPEKDEYSATKQALMARMDVAMGGRVAEELLFGPEFVTTGASSDFTQATRIARSMVIQFGMSEKIGPMVFSEDEIDSMGPELKTSIDSEIKRLLEVKNIKILAVTIMFFRNRN
jgi:ATP-dependent metalloprotease